MYITIHPFIITTISLFLCVVQTGCDRGQKISHQPEVSKGETLTLNEGNKWQVDDHTRKSLTRMNALVEDTPQEELGKVMAGEINNLFEGCTMQGPAHDQLHIFLTGLLGNVNGLYSSKTRGERSVEIEAIRKSLKAYEAHFE